MPKTIESRSLSAPPSHTISPKSAHRGPHPLSKQVFSASDPPTPIPQPKLPLKHSWRRQWSKDPYLKRVDVPEMHVILDARMSLASVQITTPPNKPSSTSSHPTSPGETTMAHSQSVPPQSTVD
ncbi:hypothetical protein FRC08_018240 [Ceratobasidium sp. 394]|nr:hypothetical protein FRC08_018240 [Ceratobasidium sp. 394]KAG9081502.1 hypothetical protein FS749_007615 [Ceratobasidium sp. UAMH 11750]